jgi:hypothetical protein
MGAVYGGRGRDFSLLNAGDSERRGGAGLSITGHKEAIKKALRIDRFTIR